VTDLRQIELEDFSVRPFFGTLGPSAPVFDDIGTSVYYLRPDQEHRLSLCRYEIASQATAVIVGSEARSYDREEELRRERLRQQSDGVTGFALRGSQILVDEGGVSRVVGASDGSPHGNYNLAGLRNCCFLDDESVVGTTGTSVEVATKDGARAVLRVAGEVGVQVGVAEYVAQEELDRLTGLWPDPSGARVALTVVDDRHVPEFPLLHLGTEQPEIETVRYPFVGKSNAHCALEFVEVASATSVPCALSFEGGYLAAVVWRGPLEAIVTRLSRKQDVLEWFLVHAETGRAELLWREEGSPWVNLPVGIFCLEGGSVVTTSEADEGFSRLMRLEPDGKRSWLTGKPLIVESLLGVRGGIALVSASGGDVRERHLYLVPVDPLLEGASPKCVSTGLEGFHTGALSEDGKMVVDVWSSRTQPAGAELLIEGARRVLSPARSQSLPFELVVPEFVDIPAASGITLYGCTYRPHDWKGGPAVVIVYGGPHVQLVQDSWRSRVDLLAQYLAAAGVMVFKLDNRGSWGRGRRFEGEISHRFGTIELDDQLRGVEYLIDHEGVDRQRIGITGWSYGGFMTLTALLKAPGTFAVGVAGAPVVDFAWYDTAYTERYMGTLENNGEGYAGSSLLSLAGNLRDPLMIIHGAVDENVHFRHTARMLQAFSEAHKSVELVLLPECRHSPRGVATLLTEARARTGFLLSHLGAAPAI